MFTHQKYCQLILATMIVIGCNFTQAEWSEPVFLSELNDFENGLISSRQSISCDELTMTYVTGDYILYEANRESPEDIFSDKHALTELRSGGGIFSSWMSHDKLRLYYTHDTNFSGTQHWQRVIKVAVRDTVTNKWIYSKTFLELHLGDYDTTASLTSDELTILWMSAPVKGGQWAIYTASRPTTAHTFGDIKPVTELNDIGASSPYLSANGLSVYFSIAEDGNWQAYKGTRGSLDEPFGNFEFLDDINSWAQATGTPSPSPDEKTLYFHQRHGEPGDYTQNGIYVSHWIESPYETAVRNINEAIEAKQLAIEVVNAAIEKERTAIGSLTELVRGDRPEGLKRTDVIKARLLVIGAIHKQLLAKMNLNKSLDNLFDCLEQLQGDSSGQQEQNTEQTQRDFSPSRLTGKSNR